MLQDRLVKELRLVGISTIAAANAWLPGFIAGHNARFAKPARNAKDLHRLLTEADKLDEVIAWREVRTVTVNLTLHYDRMLLLLEPTLFARVSVLHGPEVRAHLPQSGLGSADAHGDRASKLQHTVQDMNSDVHLGAAALFSDRAQSIADHLLPSSDASLNTGTPVVT